MSAWHGLLKFHRLFLSRLSLRERKKGVFLRYRACGRSFRKRLFEQDLLTRLKVSWLLLFLLVILVSNSLPLPVFSHPCHECLTFAKRSSSTQFFLWNYYWDGHFKVFSLFLSVFLVARCDHIQVLSYYAESSIILWNW